MAFSTADVFVTENTVGTCPDGGAMRRFTLSNGTLQAEVLSYGARLVSLLAPDRNGVPGDVVLGYADPAAYFTDEKYLGCTAGRFANRIADARFELNGTTYSLERNNGPNTLHGGFEGFHHRNWTPEVLPDGVRLRLISPDGEGGFPGALSVEVSYRLVGDTVRIDYLAETDKTTVVNLTNHAYFNLAGEGAPTVLDHELVIEASGFIPTDAAGIPLGPVVPVADTPFDFRSPHSIGERIDARDEQLSCGSGYDHTFVLGTGAPETATLQPAAIVRHPASGRRLEIHTTEPGLQFYSGNHLDGTGSGRSGRPYGRRSAFCLETQHFPDSPNQPEYPSTVLEPGRRFNSQTTLRFCAE